jgi:hypothetical protein
MRHGKEEGREEARQEESRQEENEQGLVFAVQVGTAWRARPLQVRP